MKTHLSIIAFAVMSISSLFAQDDPAARKAAELTRFKHIACIAVTNSPNVDVKALTDQINAATNRTQVAEVTLTLPGEAKRKAMDQVRKEEKEKQSR